MSFVINILQFLHILSFSFIDLVRLSSFILRKTIASYSYKHFQQVPVPKRFSISPLLEPRPEAYKAHFDPLPLFLLQTFLSLRCRPDAKLGYQSLGEDRPRTNEMAECHTMARLFRASSDPTGFHAQRLDFHRSLKS
jgi:hypothetical protein